MWPVLLMFDITKREMSPKTKSLLSLLPGYVPVGGSPIVCPCTIARVGSALTDFIRFSEL